MNRRQYRALTTELKTPRAARYRRRSKPTTWQRLPYAWQLAFTILGCLASFAVGNLAVTMFQAAIPGL